MTRRKLPALMLLSLWALLLIPVLVLCAIPVSDAAQAMLGLFAVLLVVVLKPFARSIVPRMALVGVASIVVLRYWFWRVTATLPDPGLNASFICAVVLLLVETYSILVLSLIHI